MHEHVDVLIVGAGLSGIGAAHHLRTRCPNKSFAILEGRARMGGTWDLFRYPGIRSDSDMYTLGYNFRPWTHAKAIADGPSILEYIQSTAREDGSDQQIRYRHTVKRAAWSSDDARWTVEVERGEERERVQFSCNFLHMCTGYYSYEAGYTPDFEGMNAFTGQIVHPQNWSEDIAYAGKRVVVIGSGATAVTLVPELAKQAAHVTMLQRSPTYMISRPGEDALANGMRTFLPARLAYGITRWKNVLLGMFFFWLARRHPKAVKQRMIDGVREHVGSDYDVETHFTPRYNPWDQRVCLVPDADLFDAVVDGSASIVTDTVQRFSEKGLELSSGRELEADLIITATGLDLKILADLEISVDGQRMMLPERMAYKGMMFSDVPNLAWSMGYTNASWTLKCDLTCGYVCRLLKHMDSHGYTHCTPHVTDPDMEQLPWIDFTSGYVQRSLQRFPTQGARTPWRLHQNYALDILALRFGRLEDGSMIFQRAADKAVTRSDAHAQSSGQTESASCAEDEDTREIARAQAASR